MEHERTADYWQDKHRALKNAVYNSEHDIVPCVQCGCKIVAPLLADSPRCKDCREGIPLVDDCQTGNCRKMNVNLLRYELDRLRALLRLIAVDSGCHDGVLSEDVLSLLKTETGIEPLFGRTGVGSGD